MHAERIAEAWSLLDRDLLAQVARRGPEPVCATISGAHDEAHARSALPEQPPGAAALDDLVVRVRLDAALGSRA